MEKIEEKYICLAFHNTVDKEQCADCPAEDQCTGRISSATAMYFEDPADIELDSFSLIDPQ